jgi:hypothetical protein
MGSAASSGLSLTGRAKKAQATPKPAKSTVKPGRETIPEQEAAVAADQAESAEAAVEAAASGRGSRWLALVQRTMGSLSYTGLSAVIHMCIFIILSLTLGNLPEKVENTKNVVEVPEWMNEQPDLLRVELEPTLALVTERKQAVETSAALFVNAASAVSGGGGGGGATGSGPGPGGPGGPVLDMSVLTRAGRGIGTGEGFGVGDIVLNMPSGRKLIGEVPDGQIGDGRAVVQSYESAMDRLTQEIVWMLEKGPSLVVWAFDQSESMQDDQKEIRQRIEHVYAQLGLLNKSKDDSLQTAVTSYGDQNRYLVHTKYPTHELNDIMAAIDEVPVDKSGKEYMCSAIQKAIGDHKQYAQRSRRQMAMIIVTDESGERADNEAQLEKALAEAKAARCKLYVLGREAVFGYPFVHIRWVHPQTKRVHWLPIDRGPETAFAEQLQIDGFHRRYDAHPSGFGPYECSRLGRETGGIFFMLPSLETNLVRGDKRDYSMEAPYFPDLRTRAEVKADIDKSPMRTMLEKVIYDLNPYNPAVQRQVEMRVEFVSDYDLLAQQIKQEVAKSVVYLDYLAKAETTVGKMENVRKYEASPRWQANYDLLYAQLIAYQARMYEYAAFLDQFGKDLEAYIKNPANPKNAFKPPPKTRPAADSKSPALIHDEWHIRTRAKTITGDKIKPYVERATAQFKAVIDEHPGTPWAARADYELKRGFGVELVPIYDIAHPAPTGTPIPIPKY